VSTSRPSTAAPSAATAGWSPPLSSRASVRFSPPREEQRVRFLKRIDLPEKNWKFSASDVRERRCWDEYQHAFSDMLSHTSTEWAPWHVIPADHKWFARICAAAVIAQTLIEIDPRYPVPDETARQELLRAKAELEAEAPPGTPQDPVEAKLAKR
jgi:Polyphosphate kinase 2 (PPK2)